MLINENFPGSTRTSHKYFTYHLIGCNDDYLSFNGIGFKETMKPSFNRRDRGNNDYLILLFYDDIHLSVNKKSYSDIKNKWIILKPGTSHSYGQRAQNWCHSWIHLSGDFLENELEKNNIPLDELQTTDISSLFEDLLYRLHQEIFFNPKPEFKILKNHLNTFFIQVSRLNHPSIEKIIPEPLVEVKQILDFCYKDKWSLSSLAKIAGCTVPYLCLNFKRYYNQTPGDYHNKRKIDIAKNFLINSNMRINEISFQVGYDDIYYFSKAFKKRVGSSPKKFRDQYRRTHKEF